jgi:hypothetical protein
MHLNVLLKPVAEPKMTDVTTQALVPESEPASCFTYSDQAQNTHVLEVQVDHPSINLNSKSRLHIGR